MGINHIALEVGNIDEALEFYSSFLNFELKSKGENAAFIYFGDQFINFAKGRSQSPDDKRHFGIAVDDKELVRETLKTMGVEVLPGRFLDFLDPWGNRGRDHDLSEHPVHQGAWRSEGHGVGRPRQDRRGEEGTGREGHGAGLRP